MSAGAASPQKSQEQAPPTPGRRLELGLLEKVAPGAEGREHEVVALGPRQIIYEETHRLVRRDER